MIVFNTYSELHAKIIKEKSPILLHCQANVSPSGDLDILQKPALGVFSFIQDKKSITSLQNLPPAIISNCSIATNIENGWVWPSDAACTIRACNFCLNHCIYLSVNFLRTLLQRVTYRHTPISITTVHSRTQYVQKKLKKKKKPKHFSS